MRVDPRRLYELRRRILRAGRPDAPVATAQDDDPRSAHFGGLVGERVVVCASFYLSTSPLTPGVAAYQLRFMATDVDVQGRGYGARVLGVAEADLAARGVRELWANARDTALGFYRATGWAAVPGSEHLSAETDLPHTLIVKHLASASPVATAAE